ncbi:MAG: DUF4058 family protein [Anaerolineae bacterium]|nr:DUF4058 family protein [Anaerolineae bacterium]
MPSPFPGMDPFLEGRLWPDVHHRLAAEIARRLTPLLRPRYVARLEVVIVQDEGYAEEIGVMYPDVEVLRVSRTQAIHDRADVSKNYAVWPGRRAGSAIPPAPLVLALPEALEFRQVTVEVRRADDDRLVTAIELLSPVNKRDPGLSEYRRKRSRLHRAGVHLLEIDLIRRGARPLPVALPSPAPYLVALTRGQARHVELWPLQLSDPLPLVPVPLLDPDPDVPLDLSAALATIYDEAAYDLSIDYSATPPPPPFSAAEMDWIKSLSAKTGPVYETGSV